MNASEICHLFAAQDYGRNRGRRAGNVYSCEDTRTLYSYGPHFPLATHTGNPALPVLITSRTYSVTTTRHTSDARRALWHLNPIAVPDPRAATPGAHARNASALFREAARAFAAAGNPRIKPDTRERHLAHGTRAAATAERYRKAFAVPVSDLDKKTQAERKAALALDPANPGPAIEALRKADEQARARMAKANKEREKRQAEALAEREREDQEKRQEWLAGRGSYYPREHHSAPARLRVNGSAVETSHGARVHVRDAARLWPIAERAHRTGTTYRPEPPHRVGPYPLDEVSPAGVRIGCHFIAFKEMERIRPEVFAAAEIHKDETADV